MTTDHQIAVMEASDYRTEQAMIQADLLEDDTIWFDDPAPACKTCGEPTHDERCPECGAGITATYYDLGEYLGDGIYRDASGMLWCGDNQADSGKDTPPEFRVSDGALAGSCRLEHWEGR